MFEHFADIWLVDRGSIQESSGRIFNLLETFGNPDLSCNGHGRGGVRAAFRATCASPFENGFQSCLSFRHSNCLQKWMKHVSVDGLLALPAPVFGFDDFGICQVVGFWKNTNPEIMNSYLMAIHVIYLQWISIDGHLLTINAMSGNLIASNCPYNGNELQCMASKCSPNGHPWLWMAKISLTCFVVIKRSRVQSHSRNALWPDAP